MIEALIRVGRAVLKQDMKQRGLSAACVPPESMATHLGLFAEQAYNFESIQKSDEPNYPYITYIAFDFTQEPPSYVGVEKFRQMGEPDNDMVVFRGAVGGAYATPTIKGYIKDKVSDSKIGKECRKVLKNFLKTMKRYDEGTSIKAIHDAVKDNKELRKEIESDLEHIARETFLDNRDVNFIVSLGYKESGTTSIFTEDKELSTEVLKMVKDAAKFNEISKEEVFCSSCKKKGPVLTLSGKPWSFFTLDKPSYRSNSGFREAEQFPLCVDCATLLEIGRCYVERVLDFRLATYDFYLIPRLVIENEKNAKSLLTIKGDYLTSSANLEDYSDQENALFKSLGRRGNGITYDMLFYETQQSKFIVKMHIRDVTPSKINQVHQAMKNTREMSNLRFDFWSIRKMFMQRNDSSDSEILPFLEMLDSIFTGQSISRRELQKSYLSNHKTKVFGSGSSNENEKQSSLHYYFTTAMRNFMAFLDELGQLGI